MEDFQNGNFRVTPTVPSDVDILYRGWMLSGSDYEALVSALSRFEAKPVIPTDMYLSSHHLPNWYPHIKHLTPETRIYPADCDLEAELRSLDWQEYFIQLRVVEVGDGQVSDLVGWTPEQFAKILKGV